MIKHILFYVMLYFVLFTLVSNKSVIHALIDDER